jgi:hypothetical protein
MQRCNLDDSLSSSNGSWMDDDSNAKGDTNEIDSTIEDGD